MKKRMMIALASLLLAVGSAYAQTSRQVADIPFDFMVGNKAFPAGEYTITPLGPDGATLMLRNADENRLQAIMPHYVQSAEVQQESKLVFNQYGNHFYLSQIWDQGTNQGRELRMSNREKEEAQVAQAGHLVILAKLSRVR